MKFFCKATVLSFLAAAALALVACGGDSGASSPDNGGETGVTSVTLSASNNATVTVGETITLTATPNATPTSNQYRWTVSNAAVAQLNNSSDTTITISSNTVTLKGVKAGTVSVTVSVDGVTSNTLSVTVNAVSASEPTLQSVTISGGGEIAAMKTATLEASPTFTTTPTSDTTTYVWAIIKVDGTTASSSAYATLTPNGKTATLQANNTTNKEHTITVQVTATYNGKPKSNTATVTIAAQGETVQNKLTDLTLVPEATSLNPQADTVLTAAATYSGTVLLSYEWKIIKVDGKDVTDDTSVYATLSDGTDGRNSRAATTEHKYNTLTNTNTTVDDHVITVQLTATNTAAPTNYITKTADITVKGAKITGIAIVADKETISSDGTATLSAEVATTDDSVEYAVTWEITAVNGTAGATTEYAMLTKNADGTATLTGKNTSGAKLTVTITATATNKNADTNTEFTTKTITIARQGASAAYYPLVDEEAAYADTYLEITFDDTPTINRASSGTVCIYKKDGTPVDTIKPAAEKLYGYGVGGNANYDEINAQYQLIQVIDEKTVRIIPHHGATAQKATLLENGTEYYVLIDSGLITGTVDGKAFAGITDATAWTFKTGAAPNVSGNTLTVGKDKQFVTVQGALSYLMKSGATGDWQINIDKGTYYERIFYSGKANITMSGQGSATYGTDVEIQWANQDGGEGTTLWNTGSRGRNVFYYAGGNLILENLSIINTATRKTNSYGENDGSSSDSAGGKNQAETLMFDSTGFLAAYNSNFASRQDTILLNSGRAWFYKCHVEGDVDYIWGSATAALFEKCEIESLLTEKTAYITETRVGSVGASMVGKGFVFLNSKIIGSGTANSAYLSRLASGNAKSSPSKDTYDQVAFINNTFETSAKVSANLWSATDAAYPRFIAKDSDGNVNVGWKTYGNTGVTAVTQEYAGEITESLYSTEYNGRYAILNRLYNVDYSAYQTNSAKWDLATFENRFGATADASKSNTFTEPDTSASKTVKWDFTSNGVTLSTDDSFSSTTATLQSKTGYAKGDSASVLAIVDASSGKLYCAGSNAQFNTGAIIKIPVSTGDKVTVTANSYNNSYTHIKLNGTTMTAQTDSVTADSDGYVTIVSEADNTYLDRIVLERSESDDTISATTLWKIEDYWSDTSDVSVSSSTTQGKVTLLASSDKSITISKSEKTIDSTKFTHVLKFGGSASSSATTPTARALQFKLSGAATIKVYAVTASSSNARDLMLTDGTNSLGTKSVNEAAVYAYSVSSAGTYYLYSNNSGINIYGIYFDFGSSSTGASAVSVSGNSSVTAGNSITLTANVTGTPKTASYTWTITDGTDYASFASTKGTTTKTTDTNSVTLYGIAAGTAKVKVKVDDETSAEKSVTVRDASTTADLIVTPGEKVTTNGWADMANNGAGMSYPNTTNIIVIDDATYTTASAKLTAFTNAIASGSVTSSTVNDTAAIIVLSGTVDLSGGKVSDTNHTYFDEFNATTHERDHGDFVYEIGSNKAIIGVNEAKVAFGGLQIYANKAPRTNIIIQNINFWDAHGSTEKDTSISGTYTENNKTYKYSDSKASADNLVLEANGGTKGSDGFSTYPYVPTNIWIDHCKFSDGTCSDLERNYNHDGSLDMKAGQYVTVSYCEFTNHDKVTLLAPNDTYVEPTQRQITFHHNYYHDAIQRMPRSRGCQVHLYNNYYNTIGNSGNAGYSLGPGIGSQFIVENNYFGTHQSKILKYFDTSSGGSSASTFSKLYQSGNNITFSSSNMATDGDTASSVTDHLVSSAPWTIGYTYEPTTASNLPTLISTAAGVDKEGYTATVEVNGTKY